MDCAERTAKMERPHVMDSHQSHDAMNSLHDELCEFEQILKGTIKKYGLGCPLEDAVDKLESLKMERADERSSIDNVKNCIVVFMDALHNWETGHIQGTHACMRLLSHMIDCMEGKTLDD